MLAMRRPNGWCGARRDPELDAALQRACRKILSWRIPPNWSAYDWSKEVEAMTVAARCHAEFDYDSERGVPLSAFLYQRALTCAWTRYRQEWAYALRFMQENGTGCDEAAAPHTSRLEVCLPDDSLQRALLELPFADQRLIRQLFWGKRTEDGIAKTLRISQQAVSKRKRRILGRLRRVLNGKGVYLLATKVIGWWAALADSTDLAVVCDSWL